MPDEQLFEMADDRLFGSLRLEDVYGRSDRIQFEFDLTLGGGLSTAAEAGSRSGSAGNDLWVTRRPTTRNHSAGPQDRRISKTTRLVHVDSNHASHETNGQHCQLHQLTSCTRPMNASGAANHTTIMLANHHDGGTRFTALAQREIGTGATFTRVLHTHK